MATGDAEWLWLAAAPWREPNAAAIDERGVQIPPLHYPHLSHTEIFELLKNFYKRFYFRRQKIAPLVAEMITSPQMMRRWMASNWLEQLSKCNRTCR